MSVALRRFALHHPIVTAVLCAGAQFLITVVILKTGSALVAPQAYGKVKLLAFASTVIVPVILAQVLGVWREVGLELDAVRPSMIFLASLVPCLMFLSMGVQPQEHGSIGGEAFMQFVNAFGEELLFRGVIFAVLLSLPRWKAIVLNGILFGSMHLIHGYMDRSWSSAFAQSAITSMAGMMNTGVRYATGSLWLTVLLHMLTNLSIIYSNVERAGGAYALLIVRRLANAFELGLAAYIAFGGYRSSSADQPSRRRASTFAP